MKIERTGSLSLGAFNAISDGYKIGKMTYRAGPNNRIVIDHTYVDSKFAGQGVGKRLVMEAVKFARENELQIIPVCPFVAALFERIPEIGDVLADY